MLTFSASSSVEVVAKCRVVKQASKQASSEWNGSQGYISGVLFVDGGFCVGNELSPAFKQVPALNIWQRAGFRAWEWEWTRAWMHAEQLRPSQAHLTLGTAGGVLRQTTHHSCKTLVRHGSHPARHATSFTHSLVPNVRCQPLNCCVCTSSPSEPWLRSSNGIHLSVIVHSFHGWMPV
jgi:hypothetical protein